MKNAEYPNLAKLGIKVYKKPVSHIRILELEKALKKHNLSKEKFNEYFGVQTCPVVPLWRAIYPWDAEAVLERMINNKLTGTQLFWD